MKEIPLGSSAVYNIFDKGGNYYHNFFLFFVLEIMKEVMFKFWRCVFWLLIERISFICWEVSLLNLQT